MPGLKKLGKLDWQARIDRLATIPAGKRFHNLKIGGDDRIEDNGRRVHVNEVAVAAKRRGYSVKRTKDRLLLALS